MDTKFYQASYNTPTNKSAVGMSMLFDPTSPTDSSTSMKRFERKPDLNRKKNNSRGKRQNNTTAFAGFYSPKQHNKINIDTSEIKTSNVLKDSILTRRENIEFLSSKEMMNEKSSLALRKETKRQSQKTMRKENEQKYDTFEVQSIIVHNKKLQQQVKKQRDRNQELEDKIHELSSQLKDLQKRLQNKQSDIRQHQQKQKNYQLQLTKLRQQNIAMEEHNRDQQNELDLLDRKYLEIQIQMREIKKNKDLKKRDSEDFIDKINALEAIVKQKDQELYKLIAQNDKLNCQMWIRQQRLHQLENNAGFKKDALLEQTNKKLRLVNKQLMHRVNSLLTSSSRDSSDVEFELSPQK